MYPVTFEPGELARQPWQLLILLCRATESINFFKFIFPRKVGLNVVTSKSMSEDLTPFVFGNHIHKGSSESENDDFFLRKPCSAIWKAGKKSECYLQHRRNGDGKIRQSATLPGSSCSTRKCNWKTCCCGVEVISPILTFFAPFSSSKARARRVRIPKFEGPPKKHHPNWQKLSRIFNPTSRSRSRTLLFLLQSQHISVLILIIIIISSPDLVGLYPWRAFF